MSPDAKDRLINKYGNEEDAKEFINGIVRYNLLAHELSHLYQASDLSIAFEECAANYYGREIVRHDRGNFGNALMDMRADVYGHLLATYGEDVHRLFFGTLEDSAKKQTILNSFTPDIARQLFPDMPQKKNKV